MRSGIGGMLQRAELYSYNARGRKIPRRNRLANLMVVRETPVHALSHSNGHTEAFNERERAAIVARFTSEILSDRERYIFGFQRDGLTHVEIGARLAISVRQVRRAVETINRKAKAYKLPD